MLANDGVVFLHDQLFCQRARIFLCDIIKACARGALELDFYGGGFGHFSVLKAGVRWCGVQPTCLKREVKRSFGLSRLCLGYTGFAILWVKAVHIERPLMPHQRALDERQGRHGHNNCHWQPQGGMNPQGGAV